MPILHSIFFKFCIVWHSTFCFIIFVDQWSLNINYWIAFISTRQLVVYISGTRCAPLSFLKWALPMFEREHSSLCGRSFHARHPQPGPSHRLLQPPLESVMSPTQRPTITIHRPAISHFYDVNYITMLWICTMFTYNLRQTLTKQL